jgi:hypothetical protein
MNERVNSLEDVQAVVNGLDEDEPIRLLIRHDDEEQEYVLDSLGPDVPGANQFPSDARRRLSASIERGDLHPRNIEATIRTYYWRSDPEPREATLRIGAITALSPDSISIEVYSTGGEWSLTVGSDVMLWPSNRRLSDFHLGEFVQLFTQDGHNAFRVQSLAEPLGVP